jgi:hypothetical protein
MIDFDTAIELGEEVLASLEKLYHLLHPSTTSGAQTSESRQAERSTTEAASQIGEQSDCRSELADVSLEGEAELPSLLQFRRRLLAIHAKRHLVTELVATGKLTEAEAQAMVDEGSTQTTANPGASGAAFANILAWLQTNGPAIAQDIATAIPLIISLITLFGG